MNIIFTVSPHPSFTITLNIKQNRSYTSNAYISGK